MQIISCKNMVIMYNKYMKNLTIKNLTQQYTYGDFGVQNLSLECNQGEIVAILGGNDAGKSSLLQCIAGLYSAQSGEILIDGNDITNKKPKFRDVMLVHGDGGFFTLRTVFYNLAYPLKIRKIDKNKIKQKIEEVAKKLNFSHLLDHKIRTLTGTEKVRIMIARTLLRESAVYLFDDPFHIAEAIDRHNIFMEMVPIIKSLDGAVLFATTSVDEAKTLTNSIIIMNYGYVIDEGNKEKLKNEPQCLLSYSFMRGYATNSVVTKVIENGNELFIKIAGQKIVLYSEKLINPIYINNDIIACFVTIDGKGEGYQIDKEDTSIEYYNNSIVFHNTIDGDNIKTQIIDSSAIPSHIKTDIKSIKLFDVNSEKLVYFD